jgi:DNA polymerase I
MMTEGNRIEKGWLLDLYPSENGEMVSWIKRDEDGRVVRLIDEWRDCIYVHSKKKVDLEYVARKPEVRELVYSYDYVEKYVEATDNSKSCVLRLYLKDSSRKESLAKAILGNSEYGTFKIYNVDILAEQTYFFEKKIFPFAHVRVEIEKHEEEVSNEIGNIGKERKTSSSLSWLLLDSRDDLDYEIPRLRKAWLFVEVDKKKKAIPSVEDPIKSIRIEKFIDDDDDDSNTSNFGTIIIDKGSEEEKLLELVSVIRDEIDPDIVYTEEGDSFVFPYLAKRAQVNGVLEDFSLGREKEKKTLATSAIMKNKSGTTYFSYGRVLFRPSTHKLLGRIHVDESNTFVFEECGLEGAIEVSRVCMVPIHTSLRASIGKSLSSLQFYESWKKDILVPWKATMTEEFKTAHDVFIGDRGGFVFEPKPGVHENIGEIDFSSLYPSIMCKMNLSSETVNCSCCKNTSKLRVPELGYNICEKRRGIIPSALEMLLKKRLGYKERKKSLENQEHGGGGSKNWLYKVYDARQNALKWVLVASFGYLSFRHAKFGRIDAHMAVCAYARKTLLDAAKIAESFGYEVIHGIVDSLWLKKEKATEEDYKELCKEIEKVTGFSLSFEGIYKWIVLPESNMYENIPVLNRYFGVFRNDNNSNNDNEVKVKIRGIEARRHDTPQIVSACQAEMLLEMGKARDVKSLKEDIIPQRVFEIIGKYATRIRKREVTKEDLAILKRLSKDVDDYTNEIAQSIAATQLVEEGARVEPGQSLRYVITDFDNNIPRRRVKAYRLFFDGVDDYDVEKYLDLLSESVVTILSPFGYDKEFLRAMVHNYGYQMQLGIS